MFREILVEDCNLLITGEPSERSDICARLSKLIIRLDVSCQIVAAGIVEEASEEVLDYYIAKQRVLDCAKKDN